jgi:glycosyltransferase involved in cell wall biosynthesis
MNVRLLGRRVNKYLAKNGDYKAIFIVGSSLGSYIQTNSPIFYFTDAVFHSMIGYYLPTNLVKHCLREGDIIESRMLQKATVNIFASEWAKNEAMKYYHVDEAKCVVCKFGANVDTANFVQKQRDNNIINLLFVGVDWSRKGGAIAVECVQALNSMDSTHRYELHLVGCTPPEPIKDEHVKVYGFLNRNIPEHRDLLIRLREEADVFLLPTKAECAGIVFCEASAYGIPSFTYDTGGISSYVVNGENGYRLPMGATGVDFANKIIEVINSGQQLEYMKQKARQMYDQDMSWDHWGNVVHDLIEH